jgi:hypothetical protein
VPRRKILLDACVAINLAATGSLDDIANTLQVTFAIATQAADEVGYLRDIWSTGPYCRPSPHRD